LTHIFYRSTLNGQSKQAAAAFATAQSLYAGKDQGGCGSACMLKPCWK